MDIDHEIYMNQPEGFEENPEGDLVCKLNKSLYGLKQAGKVWYEKILGTLSSMGFKPLHSDQCIFQYPYKKFYLALYVDDLLIISNDTELIAEFKQKISTHFPMKDLGLAKNILGMEIVQSKPGEISVSQTNYINSILERFKVTDMIPKQIPLPTGTNLNKSQNSQEMKKYPYQQAVGAVMYCMIASRPDISYAITYLSQFNSCYDKSHWNAIKHLLGYLKTTKHLKLTYHYQQEFKLLGYSDASWGSSLIDRKSITGYCFILSGAAVTWQSRKQQTIALSTLESEYMAISSTTQECLWLRRFLRELLLIDDKKPETIFSDNQGAIQLAKHADSHGRTKHIDIKYHFIRHHLLLNEIVLSFLPTHRMIADLLTKLKDRKMHEKLSKDLGLTMVSTKDE